VSFLKGRVGRRWFSVVLGVAMLGASVVVWRVAVAALGPAPDVHRSPGGSMSYCGYRPGMTSCDPPELSRWTVAAIVVLAAAGVLLLVGVVLAGVRGRIRRGR
jgi:hypothetical protein